MAAFDISTLDEFSEGGSFLDEEPSLEEMSIDDSLSPIERLSKYSRSDLVLHRLFVVKDIASSISGQDIFNLEESSRLIGILGDLFNDPEALIRDALLEQIPKISANFITSAQEGQGYLYVSGVILTHILDACTDNIDQVRSSAYSCLSEMLKLLSHEDIEGKVCCMLEKLASDETVESYRVEVLNFISGSVHHLPKPLVEKYLIPIVVMLSKDAMFRVRKASASAVGHICQAVGKGASSDMLLSIFCKFSTDDIWGVRKSCAESLVLVSSSVSDEVRKNELVNLFEVLVTDQSRWVRIAAFAQLGPFIASFPPNSSMEEDPGPISPDEIYSELNPDILASDPEHQPQSVLVARSLLPIPEKLLDYYESMADPSNSKSIDSEIILNCAFNFPAVIYTLGPRCWDCVKHVYKTLSIDLHWKVRRTLAFSIHEVAAKIGTLRTERDLIPTFESFLKDLDEVRIGVVTYLSNFIGVISVKRRKAFLPAFFQLKDTENKNNWRFRHLLADQLFSISLHYSQEETILHLMPLALFLGKDDVFCVRQTAMRELSRMMLQVFRKSSVDQNQPISELSDIISSLHSEFATAASFQLRLVYVEFCSFFLSPHKDEISTFIKLFLSPLLLLVNDSVPNVRISVARFLSEKFLPSSETFKEFSAELENTFETLKKLQQDEDPDVVFYAHQTGMNFCQQT